ncbi:MAG TPA: hypothetical protein VFG49_18630 [Dyella sp.]|uniref:hypothetical protein n=1 Tax=Dyella sp. TaxID=1869338 RepID=UPI002D770C6E|nr:hypothetical protein [Dyella sp.]HET6555551.1 hypothetical protein [Dyella sp.]
MLSDYALVAVGHSVVPEAGQVICCCGAALPPGHPFHRFRAIPHAPGGVVDACFTGIDCLQGLMALAGATIVPAPFCDPLNLLAVDKHRLLGNHDEAPLGRLSPLNREANHVLTLLMKWMTPRTGSDIETLAVRLHQKPADDLDAWDLRTLNTLVNRVASSVGGDMQGLVQALVRRHGLGDLPPVMHFPYIRRGLAVVGASSYV